MKTKKRLLNAITLTQFYKMKPLYQLNNHNKETLINLQVYAVLDKIEEYANGWFRESFIEVKDYIPQEILLSNLLDNLNYVFSEGIWWVELGESLGYQMESKKFLESRYEMYTRNKSGHRYLVNDRRYDPHQNILLTEEEIQEKEKRAGEIMNEILTDLQREGKLK